MDEGTCDRKLPETSQVLQDERNDLSVTAFVAGIYEKRISQQLRGMRKRFDHLKKSSSRS